MKRAIIFILIILLSLVILGPSFNLALTGDDYLGLWRYQTSISSSSGILGYLFTDYGPQDITTLIIHNFVGFNEKYYYATAYLLRLLAAFSFFPITYFITKNKSASYLVVVIFIVTATGIEVTDWSFNMPSYLAICFMNLSLYFLLKSRILFALPFFALAIISQPLRFSVLPIIYLAFTFLYYAFCLPGKKIKLFLRNIIPFLLLFGIIISFSDYGGTVGFRGLESYSKLANNFISQLNFSDYTILLNPLGQIGNALVPTIYLPSPIEKLDNMKSLLFSVGTFLLFTVCYFSILKVYKIKLDIKYLALFALGCGYTLLVWSLFIKELHFVKLVSDIVGLFVGGYFIIIVSQLLIVNWKNTNFKIFTFLALSIIVFSFLAPWIRDPNMVQPTQNRYLILTSVGVAYFLISIFILAKDKKILLLPLILLIILNAVTTYKYLYHLSIVRESKLTNSIRKSVISHKYYGDAQLYYFEADNPEILYHSIMFGFPVFMHYYHNMDNIWGTPYTTDWAEVTSAYEDGASLKRFGILKIEPVKLENIYGYKLSEGKIIDITLEIRSKLEPIKLD
jgi:hypothetical protein